MADRLHPRPAHRRHRHRRPDLHRRPLPVRTGLHRPPPVPRARRRDHVPDPRSATTRSPPRCCPTTGRSSPPAWPVVAAPQRLRVRAGPPRHRATQLPPDPPAGRSKRVQQTLKKWLAGRSTATTLAELQSLLDQRPERYNTARPHRSLAGRTPAGASAARAKARPTSHDKPHQRVRSDSIDAHGVATIRHAGKLHHIGIGRTHARTHVILLIQDLQIRVIDTTTGEIMRELILDPTRDYQPQQPRQPRTSMGRAVADVLRHHRAEGVVCSVRT
ncbi:integrase core domain-containing protein [Cellulomonas sp. Leaf395]|uniref:integrase core domain-containing protein n=1 Tax=Cellulomonas sp. Leaf395 TaxID=1736362 RepID=UPI0026C77033